MDTSTNRELMRSRILLTQGNGKFIETGWDKPDITDNEICVKAIMTGVCRSDIDMMNGTFECLPLNMQGHEGLGKVISIGKNIVNVKVGDYVATRGEPAYSDFYNVRTGEYVLVPEASPKYIIEPVACGINLINGSIEDLEDREGGKLLILGSGFLAWVAYHYLTKTLNVDMTIDVVGNSNKALWGDLLKPSYEGTYDVVVDLSGNDYVFSKPILNNNALIIFGAQKAVTTDFRNLLWKSCTMVFPSPRSRNFYYCMVEGVRMIEKGLLDVDNFWTRGYNRDTEWWKAFEDANNRPPNYSRGYIKWD